MHLRDFWQEGGAAGLEHYCGLGFHAGGPARQGDAEAFGGLAHPVDEPLPGQNGRGGDGDVALSFGALLEVQTEFLRARAEGLLQHRLLSELIAQRTRAVGPLLQQGLDDATMPPRKEAVEAFEFRIERVVAVRPHADDFCEDAGRGADDLRQGADAGIAGNGLAVLHAGSAQGVGDVAVRVHSGNNEGAEEVTLAALIYAEVRREHLGDVHFLIAHLGDTENLGLKEEGDEVLQALALDEYLRAFGIDGDGGLFLPRGKQRVLFALKLPAALCQDFTQPRSLEFGEGAGVAVAGRLGHTGAR